MGFSIEFCFFVTVKFLRQVCNPSITRAILFVPSFAVVIFYWLIFSYNNIILSVFILSRLTENDTVFSVYLQGGNYVFFLNLFTAMKFKTECRLSENMEHFYLSILYTDDFSKHFLFWFRV
jgi:hypothetical protein